MTLRTKVALFVSALFIVLAVSLYLLFNATVMRGFSELEQETALHHTAKVQTEIQNLADSTSTLAEDFSTEEDVSAAVRNNDFSHLKILEPERLTKLGVKHLVITNQQNQLSLAFQLNQKTKELTAIEPAEAQVFVQAAGLALSRRAKVGGILVADGTELLVGTAPITNKDGSAQVLGAVLISQALDENAKSILRSNLRGSLRIERLETLKADRDLGITTSTAIAQRRPATLETSLRFYSVDTVRDLLGQPALGLVISQTRELHSRGIQARNLVVLCVAAFTILGILVALSLINKGVVAPLKELGRQAKLIGENQTEELRVDFRGDKEISELSSEINKMLDQLSVAKSSEVNARLSAESESKSRAEVISRLSQELRTSLTSILGMHHVLLKKDASAANKELVAKADISAWDLVNTINKILNFSVFGSEEIDSEKEASLANSPGEQLFAFTKKLRILIADDTPTNRIILEELLSEAGHLVTSVDDGRDLLEKLTPWLTGQPNSEAFDIVLTDISMPNMDGYEATKAIRELEARAGGKLNIPIIAVTAHAMTDEQQKMREAGVDGIITKPIRPVEVSAEFKRLLPGLKYQSPR